MSNTSRFTPASIEAFKRTAKDIRRAYPLSLQQSQEVLAKVYGYSDFHAVQEHLKQCLLAGTFPRDTDLESIWSVRIAGESRFYELAQGCLPKGRLTIGELDIFGSPEARKEAMDFEAAVDAEIDGTGKILLDTQTSDYVWFEEFDHMTHPLRSSRMTHEGVFRLTEKGATIEKAMNWLYDQVQPGSNDGQREAAFDRLDRLRAAHPNNPYPAAAYLSVVCSKANDEDDDEDMDVELANEIWPQLKVCRSMFDSVMPRSFRGVIEPKLAGNGTANMAYFSLLYWGAITASAIGLDKDALAWARRSLRFHKNDSFGARFIVEQTKKKTPNA